MESQVSFDNHLPLSDQFPHQLINSDQQYNYVHHISKRYYIQQQKKSFLKYASSLIQFRVEGQDQNSRVDDMEVYEESELLNPPESLIRRYELIRGGKENGVGWEKQVGGEFYMKKITSGGEIIARLLKRKLLTNVSPYQSKQPQSLIDLLAISSVDNLSQYDERVVLYYAFNFLKVNVRKVIERQKLARPVLPIDKKKYMNSNGKEKQYVVVKAVTGMKKEGAENLVGSLTFKMLEVEKECFDMVKLYACMVKVKLFVSMLTRIFCTRGFNNLSKYKPLMTSQSTLTPRLSSISRSKSKLSKLKIYNFHTKSQKKLLIKKSHSHNDNDISTIGDQNFNEHVISSEILLDFDFTQLQARGGEQEDSGVLKQGKMRFKERERSKKKLMRESISQAETMHSKGSLQSEEYQFGYGGGVNNSKASTCAKVVSVGHFNQNDDELLQQISTEKIIHHVKAVRDTKLGFQKKTSFGGHVQEARTIKIPKAKQSRCHTVRTNLFQLPIQVEFPKDNIRNSNKEHMSKIYHMMPESQIKHQILDDIKDSMVMNINVSHGVTQSLGRIFVDQGGMLQKEAKKRRVRIKNDHNEQFQKYYFKLDRVKSDRNIHIKQSSYLLKGNQHDRKCALKEQSNMLGINKPQPLINNISSKPTRLKLGQKADKHNFQAYYFNAQQANTANRQQQALHEQLSDRSISSSKVKSIRPMITNRPQKVISPPQMGRLMVSRDLYDQEYKVAREIRPQEKMKNVKSLSPGGRYTINSTYRTDKEGGRVCQPVVCSQQVANSSSVMNKVSQSHGGSSLLWAQGQLPHSIVSTPKGIHQFALMGNQTFIGQNMSQQKLQTYSGTPRSFSPQQNNINPHFFPLTDVNRKQSFIGGITQHNTQPSLNRDPSRTIHITNSQGITFAPTVSNLSNQSKLNNNSTTNTNTSQGIRNNRMVEYQQVLNNNRPSSILSAHSNQSKERKLVGGPSQMLMSPTQRVMHGLEKATIGSNSPRAMIVQGNPLRVMNQPNSPRRGLKVLMNDNRFTNVHTTEQSSNRNDSRLDSDLRPKSISRQKIFVTMRK